MLYVPVNIIQLVETIHCNMQRSEFKLKFQLLEKKIGCLLCSNKSANHLPSTMVRSYSIRHDTYGCEKKIEYLMNFKGLK